METPSRRGKSNGEAEIAREGERAFLVEARVATWTNTNNEISCLLLRFASGLNWTCRAGKSVLKNLSTRRQKEKKTK
jgi:hypothetical protein